MTGRRMRRSVGTTTKWDAAWSMRACRNAIGFLEISGGRTRHVQPAIRGAQICQRESTNVGAVWKQTASSSCSGKSCSIHLHLLRIPACHFGICNSIHCLCAWKLDISVHLLQTLRHECSQALSAYSVFQPALECQRFRQQDIQCMAKRALHCEIGEKQSAEVMPYQWQSHRQPLHCLWILMCTSHR